jgi:hypothetical protein
MISSECAVGHLRQYVIIPATQLSNSLGGSMTRCIGLALCLALMAHASHAAAPPSEPKAFKIEPKAWADSKHAKVARIEGVTDEKGQRFVLEGLTTLQPVALGVEAKNPGDTFTLTVFKSGWKNAKRQVSTAAAPLAVTEFRTYGEAQILVASASGAKPFVLRVVVGDEARRPMKAAYVPMDAYRKRHPEAFSPLRSPWLWGGVAVVVALAGAGAFFLRKRRTA